MDAHRPPLLGVVNDCGVQCDTPCPHANRGGWGWGCDTSAPESAEADQAVGTSSEARCDDGAVRTRDSGGGSGDFDHNQGRARRRMKVKQRTAFSIVSFSLALLRCEGAEAGTNASREAEGGHPGARSERPGGGLWVVAAAVRGEGL